VGFLHSNNDCDELTSLLTKVFVPAGYAITKSVAFDREAESSKYQALVFSLDDKKIVYRKANNTADRPGAFLAIWQRPSTGKINGNKPIPLTANELDYLFIHVERDASVAVNEERSNSAKQGMFIFPVALLIEKGIVCATNSKGKTGFRVFPPWSQDRGVAGTKVFSQSGKKTQRWQLPYFIEIDDDGLMDACKLRNVCNRKSI